MKRCLIILILALSPSFSAAQQTLELSVAAGKYDRANEPVRLQILVSEEYLNKPVHLTDSAGKPVPCQLTVPALLERKKPMRGQTSQRELHFVLPKLTAGDTAHFRLTLGAEQLTPEAGFNIVEKDCAYSEIRYRDRPILRYVRVPLDESSREATYKVYHHLYDPSGSRLVTKGLGGLYTHHRGLFYGFNKVTYGTDKKVDIWHCPVAFQSHEKFLATEAGPVLARQQMEIAWHGLDKEVFATEQRELTVYNVPGGTLVEFASVLRTTDGPILLDGDPQHAGFHFRADNEVAEKTSKQTIFIRPDGADGPGKTATGRPRRITSI